MTSTINYFCLFPAPSDHLLASNRSFAFTCLHRYEEALQDAELAISLQPDWPKVKHAGNKDHSLLAAFHNQKSDCDTNQSSAVSKIVVVYKSDASTYELYQCIHEM
jgi:hypothetical protein